MALTAGHHATALFEKPKAVNAMGAIANINVDHLLGKEVGTATILKELARGGMAIVFIAYQRTLKRQIALKILPKKLLTPKTARRFQSEAESAAILSHPNIIPVYEVGETDDFLFFTMQLVQGKSLGRIIEMVRKNLLPSRRTLPLEEAVRITTEVLDALYYAHGEDIIHRDIKPDNILVEKHTQRPLITDFGVAKVLRGEDERMPMIQGTPSICRRSRFWGGRSMPAVISMPWELCCLKCWHPNCRFRLTAPKRIC
jgi:serine/threonine protein kinase